MGFLLIKILFLLGLAAASGGLFAYWWFRRHFEDVTLEYSREREEWSAWRHSFEERLAARPEVDLEAVTQQVAAVHAAVAGIDIPIPERVDLAPLHARLDELAQRLAAIRMPQLDLAPTDQRLTAIEHALFPLQTRLDELAGAVRALRTPEQPDMEPVLERLDALQAHLLPPPAKVAVRKGSRNLLSHAGHGKPDDLTQIKGVEKVLARTLHKVGVFYFWQIAQWSAEDVQHVDGQLTSFKGRIERDRWIDQAHELASQPDAARPPTTEH